VGQLLHADAVVVVVVVVVAVRQAVLLFAVVVPRDGVRCTPTHEPKAQPAHPTNNTLSAVLRLYESSCLVWNHPCLVLSIVVVPSPRPSAGRVVGLPVRCQQQQTQPRGEGTRADIAFRRQCRRVRIPPSREVGKGIHIKQAMP
jgi:hypothetical protein